MTDHLSGYFECALPLSPQALQLRVPLPPLPPAPDRVGLLLVVEVVWIGPVVGLEGEDESMINSGG